MNKKKHIAPNIQLLHLQRLGPASQLCHH